MYKRLIIFLVAVVAFVAALVYFEQQRQQPWNSDVFFSAAPVLVPAATGRADPA